MRILAMVAAFTAAVALSAAPTDPRSIVAERVTSLTRSSSWKPVASVPMKFRAFHPQGMVKIGETLFVSSVDGTRDAAEGVGHLFKIDMAGTLLPLLSAAQSPIF